MTRDPSTPLEPPTAPPEAAGDPNETIFIVRPAAEVTTKSRRTRMSFMRPLSSNIRDALQRAGVRCRVERHFSRLFVHVPTTGREIAEETLQRVFGIGSFSPVAAVTAADVEQIAEVGLAAFGDAVKGRRFAVRTKRLGKHAFSSTDVNERLGALLGRLAPVDLSHPEITVYVEVIDDTAYLFAERREGAHGLPTRSEGRGLVLISGGYDSAVTGWYAMKRGLTPDYVFFNLAGKAYERQVLQVAKVLTDRWAFGYRPRLYAYDFEPFLDALRANTREDHWQVLLKRFMVRVASRLADELGADALFTGESLGQVSSQTLSNLRTIDDAATVPVLRPLIGLDKREIIALAEQIGTAPLSAKVQEYCALTTRRPVVQSRVATVEAEEAKLPEDLLERTLASRTTFKLRALTPSDLMLPYLFTETVPEDAVLVDCQPEPYRRLWQAPEAVLWDAELLKRRPLPLDKQRVHVLYCPHGVISAHQAELLQQLGYQAYSFRGGSEALRRHLQATTIASATR